jgi:CHAT domain-containing protein/tetratricopeptide (TPR) repeat protein
MTSAGTTTDISDVRLTHLQELTTPGNRHAYLAEHPDLRSVEIVERLTEDVRRLLRIDVDAALRSAETALTIAEELGSSESIARALRAKANAFWFKGECRTAVELFNRAVELFERVGKRDEVGRTLSSSVQALILVGDYEQALGNVERAREIFTRQDDRLRLARLELNAANIHHRQERFSEALSAYETAFTELLKHGDPEGIGVALHNMAVCLISLNQFDRAMSVYESAREYSQQHQMPLLGSQADYNIAYLFYLRGDYGRAMDGLRQASETFSQNGDAYHAALCNLDLSEIYLELNLINEAGQVSAQASDQFEPLGMGYETARALTNHAIANSRKGDRGRALAVFERAKELFAREGHSAGESMVDLHRAVLLFESGDFQTARGLCRHASEFFESSGLVRKTVVCDLLLSRMALGEDDLPAAHEFTEAAIARLKGVDAPVLSYHAHLQSARVYDRAGDSEKSRAACQVARQFLENLRGSLQGDELRIAFMKDRSEVYERLVQLALEQGLTGQPAEEILGFMEQAKCRSLTDALLGRAHPLPTRIPAEKRFEFEITRLRGELNWYYHRIDLEQFAARGVSRERVKELWDQARACEDALLRAIREMPGTAVEARVQLDAGATTVAGIQASLAPDTVLVEYFQAGEQILASVVKRTGVEVVPVTTALQVLAPLRMLQLQVSKFRFGASYTGKLETELSLAANQHLETLYQKIVAPLRTLLTGSHIVWVPHGLLHDVPFHALHDGTESLIDRFTMSYAPSASIYALCRSRTDNHAGKSLVIGVDDEKTPWIRHEAQEVAAVVPDPHLLLGSEGGQEALREWGPRSRQIHLATHGFFRKDNPMFSAVRLGDSYVSLYDFYSLHLPVDLLTLSGCATGMNVVASGDELVGLARGLLYAGAHTLLLTLWSVNDKSTAEFMRSFYGHLHCGSKNKAVALKTAMLELRQRYPHPFHWAPFVLVGQAP